MPDLPPAMLGLEEPDYELMADAIFRAEGGDKAKAPYGVLSVKAKDADEARRIAITSARNNYQRWLDAGKPGAYVDFMASRWVPEKADPRGNANWRRNVPAIYGQLLAQREQPQITLMPTNYVRTVMPNYKL